MNLSDGAAVALSCQTVSAVGLHVGAAMMERALLPHHLPSTALAEGVARTATAPFAACSVNQCEMHAWKMAAVLPSCGAQRLSLPKPDKKAAEE